jgi:hypothetical protein
MVGILFPRRMDVFGAVVTALDVVSQLLPPGRKIRIVELRRELKVALQEVEARAAAPYTKVLPLLAAIKEYMRWIDCEREGDPKELFAVIRKEWDKIKENV